MAYKFENEVIDDYTVGQVDHADAPDYYDAFIESATYADGVKLNDEALERLNDSLDYADLKYQMILDWIH